MIGALLEVELDKMRTTPARESDLEVKIVKNWQARALLEFELRKICTTSAPESDLQVKFVKTWQVQSTFGS